MVTRSNDEAIVLEGCVARGNGGDGLRIEGNVSVRVRDFLAEANRGNGITIVERPSLLESLGLPKDGDPRALAELLKELQAIDDPNRQKEHVSRSALARTVADVAQFIANVMAIAGSPNVLQIIQTLSQ